MTWSWFNYLAHLWSIGTFSVLLSKLDKDLENWLGLQIKLWTQKKQIAINMGKPALLKELSYSTPTSSLSQRIEVLQGLSPKGSNQAVDQVAAMTTFAGFLSANFPNESRTSAILRNEK